MVHYAANAVVYWPVEYLRSEFEPACRRAGRNSDQALREFLGPGGDAEKFWLAVKANLQAGRVRLMFVADVIPDELRRIVEFLNEQMAPAEVLAVEIKQFAGESLKTLVPRVVGKSARAPRERWFFGPPLSGR
jgi:hypothetical protein